MGHDELRRRRGSGHRRTPSVDFRCGRARHAQFSVSSNFSNGGRRTRPIGSSRMGRPTSLVKPSHYRRRPEHCVAWSKPNGARKPADAPAGSSRRAIASTRVISPGKWWRFCAGTAPHSTKATLPSTSRGIEEPARTTYRGYTVYKHGFGSQGPVLLQTLNILEEFDLHGMGTRARTTSIPSSKR